MVLNSTFSYILPLLGHTKINLLKESIDGVENKVDKIDEILEKLSK